MRARHGAIALLLLRGHRLRDLDAAVRARDRDPDAAGECSGSLKVHGGTARRVIVLTKTDGTMTTRVAKSLP